MMGRLEMTVLRNDGTGASMDTQENVSLEDARQQVVLLRALPEVKEVWAVFFPHWVPM